MATPEGEAETAKPRSGEVELGLSRAKRDGVPRLDDTVHALTDLKFASFVDPADPPLH